jgi:hypothetical protein
MTFGIDRHDFSADELGAGLGGYVRERMPGRQSQAERLGHGDRAVDEQLVLRDQRQLDAIAEEGPQREQ